MKTQIGFKVQITIDCEDEREIIAHITAIRKELKKLEKKGIPDGVDVYFDDSNCYGTHEVKIDPVFA
jgi:hypothetical protein